MLKYHVYELPLVLILTAITPLVRMYSTGRYLMNALNLCKAAAAATVYIVIYATRRTH